MKLSQIPFSFFSIVVCSAALASTDVASLPEFTLSAQDKDQLAQVHSSFRSVMTNAQTAEERKSAIITLWENNTLTPPTEPQADADRKAAIQTTVTTLLGKGRPIFYAVRDGAATEFTSFQERKTAFAKSVAYTALITDPEKLGRYIPTLLESRKMRSSFSRDDHFAVLVLRDLASQCQPIESLNAQELANWKNLANAANAACRLAVVTTVGRVTSASSDWIAVFSETADETEPHILSVMIDESLVLPPDDRRVFLENLRDNNNALTAEQVAKINSILE